MEISFQLSSVISILCVANSLFLGIIVLKQKSTKANLFLALLLFCTAIGNLDGILYSSGLYKYVPLLIYIEYPIQYFIPPLLYFYVSALIFPDFRPEKKALLHFLPFAWSYYNGKTILFLNTTEKIFMISGSIENNIAYEHITSLIVLMLQYIVYLSASLLQLKKYEQKLKQNLSSTKGVTLSWISFLLYLFIAVFSISVFTASFIIRQGRYVDLTFYFPLFWTFLIYALTLKGLGQHSVFSPSINEGYPHKKSGTNCPNGTDYFNTIKALIEKEKLFLDPDLNLNLLSEKSGISRFYISIAINQEGGGNFYDLINKYRIKEVQRLLTLPEKKKETFLTLAFEGGFNSKSTFYKLFKKYTGVSPSEYRKSVEIQGRK